MFSLKIGESDLIKATNASISYIYSEKMNLSKALSYHVIQ